MAHIPRTSVTSRGQENGGRGEADAIFLQQNEFSEFSEWGEWAQGVAQPPMGRVWVVRPSHNHQLPSYNLLRQHISESFIWDMCRRHTYMGDIYLSCRTESQPSVAVVQLATTTYLTLSISPSRFPRSPIIFHLIISVSHDALEANCKTKPQQHVTLSWTRYLTLSSNMAKPA